MTILSVPRGLDGVVVDETAVCLADKQTDRLYYRGYAIEELAAHASYEEVFYLVIAGELPDEQQLAAQRANLQRARALPAALAEVLERIPRDCHPMDVLRTGCSMLGNLEPETKDNDLAAVGTRLSSSLPSMLFYWHHFHASGKRIDTDTGESGLAAHILHLLHGRPPSELARRAMEANLVVYAEHDFNASTFAARVASSTLTDAHSAFVAAIGTLRGALHGSANAAVLRFLEKLGSPDIAEATALEMLAQKKRIPGFGQRAYSKSDPRNAINREWAKKLAAENGSSKSQSGSVSPAWTVRRVATTRIPMARARIAVSRPIAPMPAIPQVVPPSSPTEPGRNQRCSAWFRIAVCIPFVKRIIDPITYSAIDAAVNPLTFVTTYPRSSNPSACKRSTPALMTWNHLRFVAARKNSPGIPPGPKSTSIVATSRSNASRSSAEPSLHAREELDRPNRGTAAIDGSAASISAITSSETRNPIPTRNLPGMQTLRFGKYYPKLAVRDRSTRLSVLATRNSLDRS